MPLVAPGENLVDRHGLDRATVPQRQGPLHEGGALRMLGERREPSERVVPLYLREADAVANFTTREREP